MDVHKAHVGQVHTTTQQVMVWPNELNTIPKDTRFTTTTATTTTSQNQQQQEQPLQDALLVADGFLVPGKDKGGIHVISNPGQGGDQESIVRLTKDEKDYNWFYHKASWVDLTGDGRMSCLTARSRRTDTSSIRDMPTTTPEDNTKSTFPITTCITRERPKPFQYDAMNGRPLNDDGSLFDPFSPCHLPWKEQYVYIFIGVFLETI